MSLVAWSMCTFFYICSCLVSGVWCLLCPEPTPPDARDTAALAGPGWTAPHRDGRNAHCVALISPTPPPPPDASHGTSAWAHTRCNQFCQK